MKRAFEYSFTREKSFTLIPLKIFPKFSFRLNDWIIKFERSTQPFLNNIIINAKKILLPFIQVAFWKRGEVNRYKFFTGAGPRADGFASRRILPPPEKSIALVIEVENNVMNNGGTWRGMYSMESHWGVASVQKAEGSKGNGEVTVRTKCSGC